MSQLIYIAARVLLEGTFYINVQPTHRNLFKMRLITGWCVAVFNVKPTLHRNLVVDC